MDEVIFEEFKGTGNLEIVLDRKLADRRVFPAFDLGLSGTRRESLLLAPDDLRRVALLRQVMGDMNPFEAMGLLSDRMRKTRSNKDFLRFDARRRTPGRSADRSRKPPLRDACGSRDLPAPATRAGDAAVARLPALAWLRSRRGAAAAPSGFSSRNLRYAATRSWISSGVAFRASGVTAEPGLRDEALVRLRAQGPVAVDDHPEQEAEAPCVQRRSELDPLDQRRIELEGAKRAQEPLGPRERPRFLDEPLVVEVRGAPAPSLPRRRT